MKIEVLAAKSAPLIVENKSNAMLEFLNKIQEKYPEWEEFILTNHKAKQVRMLKLKDGLVFLGRTMVIGNLISYLDAYHKNWHRLGISNAKFTFIEDYKFTEGMLFRSYSSNTNPYIMVTEAYGDTVKCFQEGSEVEYSVDAFRAKKLRFSLLCENVTNREEIIGYEWPDTKIRK